MASGPCEVVQPVRGRLGRTSGRAWNASRRSRSRCEQSPQGVLTALLEELDRGGSLPKSYKDLERLGVPEDVIEQLRALGEREGFAAARVVRVFIALLAERYAHEIGRPEPFAIARDTFGRGAHGMLRQVLEPMVEWRVEETV